MDRFRTSIFLLTCFTVLATRNNAKILNIGCLIHNATGGIDYLKNIARMAVETKKHIVEQHGFNVTPTFRDSGCNVSQGLRMGAELLVRENVSAIIGPSCNEACEPIASLASFSNTPMVSYGCFSNDNKEDTPNYVRIVPNMMNDVNTLATIYSRFLQGVMGWKKLTIVYQDHHPWLDLKNALKKEYVNNYLTFNVNSYQDDPKKLLLALKQDSRIVFFACENGIVADYFLRLIDQPDMLSEDKYAFLTVNFDPEKQREKDRAFLETLGERKSKKFGFLNMALSRSHNNEPLYEGEYLHDSIYGYMLAIDKMVHKQLNESIKRSLGYRNKTMKDLMESILSIRVLEKLVTNKNNQSVRLEDQLTDLMKVKQKTKSFRPSDADNHLVYQIMDAFYIPPIKQVGQQIIDQLKMPTFRYQGRSGLVQFSKQGDRVPTYVFENVVRDSEGSTSAEILFEYNSMNSQQISNFLKNISVIFHLIVWPNGKNGSCEIPEIKERKTDDGMVNKILMGLFIPTLSVLFFAVGLRIYRNQKYEGDLMNKDIIFKFKDLEIPTLKIPIDVDFEGQEKTPLSPDIQEMVQPSSPRKKKKKAGVVDILEGVGTLNPASGVRTFYGKYRRDDVFVKQLPKQEVLVTREILIELKDIRDLQNPNLNPYDGVCVGPPYVLILSPICKKGTLLDILQTEDIQLNWVFRYTFATDIAKGLQALHESPLKYHGHLTSRNVLVDSRWNCKITDYGLHKFKQVPVKQPSNDPFIEGKVYEALLWTAPENIQYPHPKKSKEGDIYSFGIILAEIINRSQGFSSFKNYTSRDIVHFIQKRCIPPFRPHVRLQSGLDGRALDLMRSCWDEFPENRPTIGELRAKLRTIHNTKNNSKNLLDDMIDMMEKYAHDLEVALNERTMQLSTEKERSEEANFMSLPEMVADFLKLGNTLVPQITNNATVMLIKICDITHHCKNLNPQQIVDLLDDVHRIVEKACDKQQVMQFLYHKEKHGIGCGLLSPVRFHASRVGKVALKIMGSLTNFGFRHVKKEDMKLSIAIHSGEFIVAIQDGRVPTFVVMGKYLTYLENILENTPRLRIFITGEALRCIKLDVGPNIEPSGALQVKGHGSIQGHYLLGIKGVNVTLPKPDIGPHPIPKHAGKKDKS